MAASQLPGLKVVRHLELHFCVWGLEAGYRPISIYPAFVSSVVRLTAQPAATSPRAGSLEPQPLQASPTDQAHDGPAQRAR